MNTASDHKWAILLELSADDHIYVTEDNGDNCWDLKVKVYDTVDEALEALVKWKNGVVVPFDQY
jgi:hypothetical protein